MAAHVGDGRTIPCPTVTDVVAAVAGAADFEVKDLADGTVTLRHYA